MKELIIETSAVLLTHEIGSAFGLGLAETRSVIRPVRIQTPIHYDGHFTKNSTHITYKLICFFISIYYFFLLNK